MATFEANIEGNSKLLAKYSTKNAVILASEKSLMTYSEVPYDYQRVAVANEVYPAIRPESGGEVEGAVLFDLDENDWTVLDRYEGDFYERQIVTVYLSEQASCPCMAYIVKPQYYGLLTHKSWSHKVFRDNHLNDFVAMLREGED